MVLWQYEEEQIVLEGAWNLGFPQHSELFEEHLYRLKRSDLLHQIFYGRKQ